MCKRCVLRMDHHVREREKEREKEIKRKKENETIMKKERA